MNYGKSLISLIFLFKAPPFLNWSKKFISLLFLSKYSVFLWLAKELLSLFIDNFIDYYLLDFYQVSISFD